MLRLKRAKRVRLHLYDRPGVEAPSIEGLLVAKRPREYVLALPAFHVAVGGEPVIPADAKQLVVPRENVMCFEVVR